MIRKWILAPLCGMLVLVAWGILFWGLLAGSLGTFHRLPDDRAVTDVLTRSGTQTGTYFMPWPRRTAAESAAFEDQHKRGPFYRLSYVREGIDPSSPQKLAIGCLHYLSVASLGVFLLWLARPSTRIGGGAVVFVGGLLGSNLITAGDPIWFHLPWDYSGSVLLYESVAWLLLGATLSAIWPKPTFDPPGKTMPIGQ